MGRQRSYEVISAAEFVTIGELVRLTDTRYSTLKFYTEQGMLPFEPTEENLTRRYRRADSLVLLARIQALKRQGLSIEQMKQALRQAYTPVEV